LSITDAYFEAMSDITTTGAAVAVAALYLFGSGVYAEPWLVFRPAAFHVVSIATTTGQASTDYALWPAFVPWLIGPAGNFQGFNDFQTWVCSFAMMVGRLELLSVLVLLTPQFWRR